MGKAEILRVKDRSFRSGWNGVRLGESGHYSGGSECSLFGECAGEYASR
jgi:hypothetical protein